MKTNKKGKVLRIIGITAAVLTACGGAAFLFLKRKKHYAAFMITAVIMCGVMAGGMTAYAAPIPGMEPDGAIAGTGQDSGTDILDAQPDEVITGEKTEVDISKPYDPEQPPKLTPPGNLSLVDDLSGAQTNDKQFITVTTKSGNTFYIIIDRVKDKENVYFLNLVDEADLLAIMEKEKAPNAKPAPVTPVTPEQHTATPAPTPAEPKSNNTMGLLIMTLIIAAIGGGAFYYFKVLKPKQGGGKKSAGTSELDEFNFDPDEDDFIGADKTEKSGENEDFEGDIDMDEDMPDFTAVEDTAPDNNESEDK